MRRKDDLEDKDVDKTVTLKCILKNRVRGNGLGAGGSGWAGLCEHA